MDKLSEFREKWNSRSGIPDVSSTILILKFFNWLINRVKRWNSKYLSVYTRYVSKVVVNFSLGRRYSTENTTYANLFRKCVPCSATESSLDFLIIWCPIQVDCPSTHYRGFQSVVKRKTHCLKKRVSFVVLKSTIE